jgi:hypothetical protein
MIGFFYLRILVVIELRHLRLQVHHLRIEDYLLRIEDYLLRIEDYLLRIEDYLLQILLQMELLQIRHHRQIHRPHH